MDSTRNSDIRNRILDSLKASKLDPSQTVLWIGGITSEQTEEGSRMVPCFLEEERCSETACSGYTNFDLFVYRMMLYQSQLGRPEEKVFGVYIKAIPLAETTADPSGMAGKRAVEWPVKDWGPEMTWASISN